MTKADDSRPVRRATVLRTLVTQKRNIEATARPESILGSLDETYDMTSAVMGLLKRSERLLRSSSDLHTGTGQRAKRSGCFPR